MTVYRPGQCGHHLTPRGGTSGDSVDQKDGRPLTGHPIPEVVAMNLHML